MNAQPAVELAWSQSSGGETCLDRAGLVARVEGTVGHPLVFASNMQADTLIDGSVGPGGPAGSGWLAVIEARRAGTTFRRELALSGTDCHRLDEAIVLVVALMMDSAERAAPLAIRAAPEAAAVAIGADVAVAPGMLPDPAVGIGLTGEVKIPPLWPIALRTTAWPTSDARLDGAGGKLGAWTFSAGLCPVTLARREWALYACAGATGGAIDSSGLGLDVSHNNTRGYLQAELWTGIRLRVVGPLFAVVEVGGAVPFARDSYSYAQADGAVQEVFKTAAFIPIGHARIEVRVP